MNKPALATILNCNVIIAKNRWAAFPRLQQEKDGERGKKV